MHDPAAADPAVFQAFTADVATQTIERVSSAAEAPRGCYGVTMSGDGTKIACDSGDLLLFDRTFGSVETILPDTQFTSTPRLSADGKQLAFVSALDLDPRHTNPDFGQEVYIRNLETGDTVQVTDTVGDVFAANPLGDQRRRDPSLPCRSLPTCERATSVPTMSWQSAARTRSRGTRPW